MAGEADLSGRDLGGYHLLRSLGRGAMADVYLAEQRSLRRPVALKILRGDLAANETYVKRFHQEARAAALLVHPNIVQIYEIGEVDGLHFIAQEYVEGSSLAELVARRGACEPAFVASVLRQVTSALSKAADERVVHRDIKPENILLTRDAQVKVADFGLARLALGDRDTALTQTGITMGTPLYMSPEQVEGKPLDVRSDMYSLGVTCYHLLAGRPPFEADTAVAVAVQHLHHQPKRLESLCPDAPRELCDIVHRLLAKRPEERYASPRELLAHLHAGAAAIGLGASREVEPGREHGRLPHIATTERLSVVMRAERARAASSRFWWILVPALLVAFAIGLAASQVARDRPLLAPDGGAGAVNPHGQHSRVRAGDAH